MGNGVLGGGGGGASKSNPKKGRKIRKNKKPSNGKI